MSLVFPLVCPVARRFIAFLTDPVALRAILAHLGAPTAPPRIARAQGPPAVMGPGGCRGGAPSIPTRSVPACPGDSDDDIDSPTLLVDLDAFERNHRVDGKRGARLARRVRLSDRAARCVG